MRGDDKNGHLVCKQGDYLNRRYKICSKIGKGSFGQVLECWDREAKIPVAIKVVRSDSLKAAKNEIDVLNYLAKNDKVGSCFVKIVTSFNYRKHICIVCEKLGPSLHDSLRRSENNLFPVELVREFGCQLIKSVAHLGFSLYCEVPGLVSVLSPVFSYTIGMHDLQLVHTDLKPANILLVSDECIEAPNSMVNMNNQIGAKSSAIKLIDFGTTANGNLSHDKAVATRPYRAPEIILGLGWSYPCDLWSIGCVIVRLCTGENLFPTFLDDNQHHLAMMENVLGPIPQHMIRKAKFFLWVEIVAGVSRRDKCS